MFFLAFTISAKMDGLGFGRRDLKPFLARNLHNPLFKGSLVINNMYLVMKNIEFRGKHRYMYLKQKVFSYSEGMAFEKHHCLYSSFNEKIQQLTSGGFTVHWLEEWTKHRSNTEKPPPPGPEVLKMDQLSIGFQIWLIMLGVSFLAFVVELCCYWIPTLYHLMIFEQTLKVFFRFHM